MAQATIREQVVDFLKKKRGTQNQALEIFGLSQSGVEKIWRKYKTQGKRGNIEKKRGVQGGKKINSKQSAEVRRLIKDKLPDQLKLSFGLWTREAVQQLILDRYGKKRPINKAQMRANVEDFMNRRKDDRKKVQKYFHVSHVRYAA